MKVGIFGGSFNPIHNGHLIIAEFIREAAQLDLIFFIPVGNPSHRENDLVSAEHRMNMLQLAIKNNEKFKIIDIELKSGLINYTIDTLKNLQYLYPEIEFCEIIGEDSACYIEKWKNYEQLLELSKVYVFKRSGYTYSKDYKNIFLLDTPVIEISATEIRKREKEDKSIKYLVPIEVEEYIKNNKLYKEKEFR